MNYKQNNYDDSSNFDTYRKELLNLEFVHDDKVLRDDAKALIISLVEEYYKIHKMGLKHNIELSQFYLTGKEKVNETCEIVLKYISSAMCITKAKICAASLEKNCQEKINCNVSHGVIRFYIKHKKHGSKADKYECKYELIRVAKIHYPQSLGRRDSVFVDNEKMAELEASADIATHRAQTNAIRSNLEKDYGSLNESNVNGYTARVTDIITATNDANRAAILSKMNSPRIASPVPSQQAVETANAVVVSIRKSPNDSIILVPGNDAVMLGSQPRVNTQVGTNAMMGGDGTTVTDIRTVPGIAVDSNLAVVPTKTLVSDASTIIVPSNKTTASMTNKLASSASGVVNKTGELVDSFGNKTGELVDSLSNKTGDAFDYVKTKFNEWGNKFSDFLAGKQSTVVPVNKNLSVQTNLPPQEAVSRVPIPLSANDSRSSAAITANGRASMIREENLSRRNNASASRSASIFDRQSTESSPRYSKSSAPLSASMSNRNNLSASGVTYEPRNTYSANGTYSANNRSANNRSANRASAAASPSIFLSNSNANANANARASASMGSRNPSAFSESISINDITTERNTTPRYYSNNNTNKDTIFLTGGNSAYRNGANNVYREGQEDEDLNDVTEYISISNMLSDQ